jgi:putative acetyltransferase
VVNKTLEIREDDLTGETIAEFLREHLDNMHEISPPESVHAMGIERLRAPDITFWSAWDGEALVGCGALRELDSLSGEVKSMRTVVAYRGRGVGSRILETIIGEASRRGYERLLLETGSEQAFAPAQRLYERYGFTYRGPFAEYIEDPNSVFMEKELQERRAEGQS